MTSLAVKAVDSKSRKQKAHNPTNSRVTPASSAMPAKVSAKRRNGAATPSTTPVATASHATTSAKVNPLPPLADEAAEQFLTCFAEVKEVRREHGRTHQLIDILFIAVVATIANADGPTDIAAFAIARLAWFRKFVPLANGVPSHDTIGRVLALLKPAEIQRAFLAWLACWHDEHFDPQTPEHVAIDGKTARGSHSKTRDNPLHLVSAWASRRGLTLGQVAVAEKSNEITAIPHLIETIDIQGAIVSIDAMGCQRDIAAKIMAHDADYVLAVKLNQPKLYEAIQNYFLLHDERKDWQVIGARQERTTERSRGRTEDRWATLIALPTELAHFAKEWKGLQSIGRSTNVVTSGTKVTTETRIYISSRPPRVREFASVVRQHWSIESMHWVLDVVFGEDHSRLRVGQAVANFSLLKKFAISLLKQDTSPGSLKCKRKKAGWSVSFLEEMLFSRGF